MCLRVSEDQLRITLLRLSPGQEKFALGKWKPNPETLAGAFIALGRSDLITVEHLLPGAAPTPDPAGLPAVMSAKLVDCYGRFGGTAPSDVLRHPLVAMSFLRVNCDLHALEEWPETVGEQYLVEHLHGQAAEAGVDFAVLGGWGRAAGILLVGADDFGMLLTTVRELLGGLLRDGGPNGQTPRALVRECLTTVGVKWSPGDGEGVLEVPHLIPREGVSENARVVLEMRCCSANLYAFAFEAEKWWEARLAGAEGTGNDSLRVAKIFGPADLHISFDLVAYSCLNCLAADLIGFREEFSTILFSTEAMTELRMSRDTMPQSADRTLVEPHQDFVDARLLDDFHVDMPTDAPDKIAKIDEEGAILSSIHAFNHRLRDDGGEAVQDLIRFYSECARIGVEIGSAHERQEAYYEDLMDLHSLLATGQIGQMQRCDNVAMTRRAGADLGPYRSGIRRLLWAAESVPHYVLHDLLDEEWTGFVIAGQFLNRIEIQPPVITLPADAMRHPERWWPLPHEAMHDYLGQLRERSDPFAEIEDFIEYAPATLDRLQPQKWSHERVMLLAEECCCDALEHRSLCGAISEQDYLRIAWAYELEQVELITGNDARCDMVAEYILRTYCVLRDRDPQSDPYELLSQALPKAIDTLGTHQQTFYHFWGNKDFRGLVEGLIDTWTTVSDWTRKRPELKNHSEGNNRLAWASDTDGFRAVKALLDDGKAVKPGTLRYPDLLVWLLRLETLNTATPLGPKTATAAILSLLWFYLERYSNFDKLREP